MMENRQKVSEPFLCGKGLPFLAKAFHSLEATLEKVFSHAANETYGKGSSFDDLTVLVR